MSVVNTGSGPGVRMLTEVWYSKVSMFDSDCQHNIEQYGRGGTADIRNTNSVYTCCHQLLKSVGFQRKCRRSWQVVEEAGNDGTPLSGCSDVQFRAVVLLCVGLWGKRQCLRKDVSRFI